MISYHTHDAAGGPQTLREVERPSSEDTSSASSSWGALLAFFARPRHSNNN